MNSHNYNFFLLFLLSIFIFTFRTVPFSFWFNCKSNTSKMEPLNGTLVKEKKSNSLIRKMKNKIKILQQLLNDLHQHCHNQPFHHMIHVHKDNR